VPPLTSCTPTKSNLYFDISVATVMNVPALYRLLTVHVPNLMSIFLSSGHLCKEPCPSPRICVTFVNTFIFYGEDLQASRPISKLEKHPLSSVLGCLFNILAAALPI
jgi:hypothetical protein